MTGEGACLVGPTDPQPILEGYKRVIADPQKYIKAGSANVQLYTVEAVTRVFFDIYMRTVKG